MSNYLNNQFKTRVKQEEECSDRKKEIIRNIAPTTYKRR